MRIQNWHIEVSIIVLVVAIMMFIGYITKPSKGEVIVINCTLSEISPDFTTEMREACRQVRAKKY